MKELCLVPTFQRSDLLYCVLESIRNADREIPLHVFPDRGTHEPDVCERFSATEHEVLRHGNHGNTYNMLEALKFAYFTRAEIVYVVEDDAILDPSFFSWCRPALERHPEAFAACGWQYSPDAIVSDGPDLMIPWYLSVCVALPRASVGQIIEHACPAYYNDMQGYLDRIFPRSFRKGSKHYEQDGLVLRIAEAQSARCIWPRRPRATHCGWYGYHMQGKPIRGSLEDRVKVIKLLAREPAMLKRLMVDGRPPRLGKCEVCQELLAVEDRSARTICVKCFHKERPELAITAKSFYYLKPSLGV